MSRGRGELFVVPAERHVERLARDGKRAETRTALRARLAATLLPDLRFADPREVRLTLAIALEQAVSAAGQLALFGAAEADADDPILATLRGRGGASWVRAVLAIDDAIGALRARGATMSHLERVRGGGVAPARARTLAAAMRALDELLARSGARDGRLAPALLAPAIRAARPELLETLLGTRHVRARWVLAWDPSDSAWWRALDEVLSRGGGYARIVLPVFDKRLEGGRERDPFEVIAEVVARQLDAAPETEPIASVLGDLGATPPKPADFAGRVRLVRVAESRAEARVVARLVRGALDRGGRVERIVIAYPSRDERTLLPLRRALEGEKVVFHDVLGPPPSTVPVVAAALHSLVAAESLDRIAVARLLRSGYIDAPRVLSGLGIDGFREAERVLGRLAQSLASRATASGTDEAERLVLTAAGKGRADEGPARCFVDVLVRARSAKTRGEHVRRARALFLELGFGSRAGRGALSTFARDEAPSGVDRAERFAVARDVRAWEGVEAALDAYEATSNRAGGSERVLSPERFRLELTELLDASSRLPNAGRAGAVRVTHLADVAGDELDLLIVVDANDGILPRDVPPVTLVSEALEGVVSRAARDGFVPSRPAEMAARDLAALATAAAEAERIVFVTTAEDGGDTPASPARVFAALERAGLVVESALLELEPALLELEPALLELEPATVFDSGTVPVSPSAPEDDSPANVLHRPGEIARRRAREHARESFFLDPRRQRTDIVGDLTASPTMTAASIRALVGPETGAGPERALAVTSIERFAQCPFKGYAHVVLAAREGEEQQELPDAREEGNLGHTALHAAFLATHDAWPRRPRDAEGILRSGLEAADRALSESAGHAPLRAIVRLRVRESVRAILVRALADEEWDFALAEQAFGQGKPWLAFHVRDEEADLWLRGSIDRVDRGHQRAEARVIDYKRSKSTVRDSTGLLGETALQVPVYAAVARDRLEVRATGAYLPMQPRDLATETKSSARAEDRVAALALRDGATGLSEIERRVLALAKDARSGQFAPLPAREAECTHCSVSGGCRKPRFAMAPSDESADKDAT